LYRAWTQSEYTEAVKLRNGGASWGQIAKRFNTSKENARAAYRRAVGAKHGAYSQESYPPDNESSSYEQGDDFIGYSE